MASHWWGFHRSRVQIYKAGWIEVNLIPTVHPLDKHQSMSFWLAKGISGVIRRSGSIFKVHMLVANRPLSLHCIGSAEGSNPKRRPG